MRIAHVVTYISADGAFGGPVAVAMGQAAELARRGHHVEIIAGWDGRVRATVPGVTMRLFKARRLGRGFSTTVSLALQAYFRKHVREFDVIHIHLARDLITLPVALHAIGREVTLVLQTHGMVMPDDRTAVWIVDAVATRRALVSARAILVLTDREAAGLSAVAGPHLISTRRIANGIARAVANRTPRSVSPPVVLFLARLHPRKRVMAFAEAGKQLIAEGLTADFRIIGPDEGDGAELERFISTNKLEDHMTYAGPIGPGDAAAEMHSASVYVLPSFGEVFPMTVLEAMAAATPVVMTSDSGIAHDLAAAGAAVITDGSVDQLAAGIRQILLDAGRRNDIVTAARTALADWLSIEAVADRLEETYAS